MTKVDIGDLPKILEQQPELRATVAYGTKAIVANDKTLGDFASIVILGTDEQTPEIIMLKSELVNFAQEILNRLGEK